MLRYSAKLLKNGGIRRLMGTSSATSALNLEVDVSTSQQKSLRERALAEALAREEEALAKEKALRELKSQTLTSVSALNSIPTKLIHERLQTLQMQLDSLEQSKVQSLNLQMEQFLYENMKIPDHEQNHHSLSENLRSTIGNKADEDQGAQSIKTTATSAYASEYPNLKPTPDYKPYSSQELFLRHLAHTRRSGRLGSNVNGVYKPNEDVRHPSTIEDITIASLMAAGCHLGHAKAMWRPSTQPFISGEYEGIHLIDLNETLTSLRRAAAVMEGVAQKGGIILYVGTTRNWEQHRSLEEAAKRSKGFYVSHRWIPGTITNFTEVSKQIGGQQEVEVDFGDQPTGRFLDSQSKALIKPDLVVLLNPVDNRNCINECIRLRIPTIALCDTNMEPSLVTYPIPCNDDSTRASSLIVGALSKAAESGVLQRLSRFESYKRKGTSKISN